MKMKHIHTFESFLNESAGDEVIFSVDDDKLDAMLNDKFSRQLDYQDIKGDSFYSLPRKEFDRFMDMADSAGFDVDYENSEDSVVIVEESTVAESYRTVPYNVKISGEYEITIGTKVETTKVAGFERQNDDSDSLYFMDEDPLIDTIGSLIVKNSDMPKLQKGTVVKAKASKSGQEVKIKRIGDL
jgi:hypothetical protein